MKRSSILGWLLNESWEAEVSMTESDRNPHTLETPRSNCLWAGAGLDGVNHAATYVYKPKLYPSCTEQGGKKSRLRSWREDLFPSPQSNLIKRLANDRLTTTTHAVLAPHHSSGCAFSVLFLFSVFFFAPVFHIQWQGRLKARACVSIDAGGTLAARVGGRLRQPWTSTN